MELTAFNTFVTGFILWWIAYGALGREPWIFKRISTHRLLQGTMMGSGAAIFLIASGHFIVYLIVATIVGAFWGTYWTRVRLPKVLDE